MWACRRLQFAGFAESLRPTATSGCFEKLYFSVNRMQAQGVGENVGQHVCINVGACGALALPVFAVRGTRPAYVLINILGQKIRMGSRAWPLNIETGTGAGL
jgi:hypothetical protein